MYLWFCALKLWVKSLLRLFRLRERFLWLVGTYRLGWVDLESEKDTPVWGLTMFLFTFTDSLSWQNIFCSSDNLACIEVKLQVCWTFCGVFCVLGLGLSLPSFAGWFLEPWELCCLGQRFRSGCCWALIAWLSAAKFFSCCLFIRASSSTWARRPIWSMAIWNSRSNLMCGLGLYCKP